MSCRSILFAPLFLFCTISISQVYTKPDSLFTLLSTTKEDSIRLKIYFELFRTYYSSHSDSAIDFAKKGLTLSEKLSKKSDIALFQNALGQFYIQKGNYASALEYHLNALRLREALNNKKDIAISLNNIGLVYQNIGEYDKSLKYYFKALEINRELKNKEGIAHNFGNISIIYSEKKLYDESIRYGLDALKIWKELNNSTLIGSTLGNLGATYNEKKEYTVAITYYRQSLEICKQLNDVHGIAIKLHNIGELYKEQKQYDSAFANVIQSLQIAKSIRDQEMISANHLTLSDLYSRQGNYKEAYQHHLLFYALTDSLLNEKITGQISDLSVKYETEKKELQIKSLKQEKLLKETQITHQKIINYFIASCLILVLGTAFFIFKNYREKKKLSESLSEKNKDITDSINYAKKIQTAILPKDEDFKIAFPESFILYKPKDIVSGDFYWISSNPKGVPFADTDNNNKWRVKSPLIAAVDCTGHGVPGSLMSMIGYSLLNKIVQTHGINKPGEILNQLRQGIIQSLQQSDGESKDGMDITLCVVHDDRLEFAGANNPLYMIKEGKLEKIKGDKMPIGYYEGELKPYTNHEIKINKGDCFYIFTDGYADQFGGSNNKKFKYKQLEELLIEIHQMPLEEQKQRLNEEIEKWKGNKEQTDDILLIGIKI
jgi:serine phosphatase RsbU (regulator of sigma subunit)/Tfp pilus assembly protein PilF